MSLVNDVLRDLNSRRKLPEHRLSFPGLINNKEIEAKRPYQRLLFLISFILIMILSIQLIYKKPISKILSSGSILNVGNELVTIIPESVPTDAIPLITGTPRTEAREPINIVATITTMEAIKVLPFEVQETLLQEAAFKKEAALGEADQKEVAIAIINHDNKLIIESQAISEQIVEITKISIAGDFNYQRAIREYKQQRYSAALISINSAVRESQDEKYQVFKARILLKKKDDIGFLNFIQQQSENSSLNWFQLVAPGLQLFSYYELSNRYYLQLIKKQPKNVKWPLAMALNYSKLNQLDKTNGIYQSLLKTSLLSMKQKKWIASQIQDMDQLLDNKEGHHYGS